MKLQQLKRRVIEEHYPDKKELEEAHEVFKKVEEYVEKEYGLESHFAGSAGRGTSRKGDKDVDIFVLFPEDTSRKELEEKGLEIGKKAFKKFSDNHHIEYAEHPYTKGSIDGHEVEVVPCYDTDPENIQSAVDRTPHHTRWIEKELDDQQRKDVVALKVFLDAQGLYGSSLEVQGFSGYLCELLIAEYGSFEALIESAPDWEREKSIEVVEPEKEFESNFVVVDPVDPGRNVAAVLTEQNYAKFIFKAFQLRENPGYSMFERSEEFSEFELKKEVDRRADVLVVEFERPEEVKDVLYPQMRKLKRLLLKKLRKASFRVFSSGVHVGESCRMFFEVERSLPETETVEGPEVFHNEKHLNQFLTKYRNVFVQDERLCAKTERDFTDARNLVRDMLDGEASDLKMRGVPGGLASEVEESSFVDPLSGDEKWLKYLYRKFNCEPK
ncbi:MAG: CCA tRNA nucleotidyltransferase [Candidatus Nanohaloarchaea archaeon]